MEILHYWSHLTVSTNNYIRLKTLFSNTKEFQISVTYFIHHFVFNFKFKSLKRT